MYGHAVSNIECRRPWDAPHIMDSGDWLKRGDGDLEANINVSARIGKVKQKSTLGGQHTRINSVKESWAGKHTGGYRVGEDFQGTAAGKRVREFYLASTSCNGQRCRGELCEEEKRDSSNLGGTRPTATSDPEEMHEKGKWEQRESRNVRKPVTISARETKKGSMHKRHGEGKDIPGGNVRGTNGGKGVAEWVAPLSSMWCCGRRFDR
ncbi:hypothetical protein DFH09DRAFT_1102913 [Mycena vulgaris]|nr:hypothetical protein DFH09DRAFT_1102913 [Mycena vulgaris]